MSQRLLLRTALVKALMGATIAEARVFDTLIGPIQENAAESYLPVICVYSDGDRRSQVQPGAARPLFARTVDVTIELAVGAWMQVTTAAPQGNPEQVRVFGMVETDAELEALLDLFELQIWRRLYAPEQACLPWQKLVRQIDSWASVPGRTKDSNNKLCARQLTLACQLADDCTPSWTGGAGSEAVPKFEAHAPHLTAFFDGIAATPGLESLRDMLGELYGTRPLPPVNRALRFGFKVDAIDPADASLLPDGETRGPDGRIDIEAQVTLGDEP